jgi:predicted DNA-binding WGR domain protein/outer membrane protein assembly factor BamB
MSEERTYLELSEEGGGSHKFYEAVVKGKELTIRFGRIGDQGQTSTKKFPTPEAAKAEAQKKIAEKTRKGYAPAVMGERKKRPVTRRPVASRPSEAKKAPVLWKFESGSHAFGIFIDDDRCWVGNQNGRVFALNHDAKVMMQFRFKEGVKCLVGDESWIYAGCDDGNVYDLTGKVPRLAYQIAEDVDILWLDIWNGHLAVSDDEGGVNVFNPEEELLWKKKSKGDTGWMVRCDQMATYHGHSDGVTAYRMSDGKQLWHQKAADGVLFGWQTAESAYAGTMRDRVYALDKMKGKVTATCECDDAVLSNASSPEGEYIFAGDSASSIYCFDAKGKRLWKLGTTCGSALSMQYHEGRLYIVTTDGTLACLDASEAAVKAAEAGTVPKSKEVKAPKAVAVAETTAVETTRDSSKGVVVECVAEGSKLRVRVASSGYKKGWNVQFPRNLRQAGARYVVDEVRESTRGGFYRAYGNIRKLAGAAPRGRATAGRTTRRR